MSPTRELGQQIAKQLFKFTKYSEQVYVEAVFGGQYIDIQIDKLKRPTQIIVATPGRLIDLVNRKAVDLTNVHTVVMDEADEMLSMGFKKELDEILGMLKNVRAKWLFSATMPKTIKELASSILHCPEEITVNAVASTTNTIQQKVYHIKSSHRRQLLQQIVKDKKLDSIYFENELIKHQLPPSSKGLWGAYKEIIPALIRQSKDPNYKLEVLVPNP